MILFLILTPILIVGSVFGISESFGENGTWYVGEGLKQGDYFSYQICHVDYKDCKELQFDFWIEKSIMRDSDSFWLLQTRVLEENQIVLGQMELGKIVPEPVTYDVDFSDYAKVFKSTFGWLSAYTASEDHSIKGPKDLIDPKGKMVPIGGIQLVSIGTETISTPVGEFETVIWNFTPTSKQNKIWLVDDFPFPVKAKLFNHLIEEAVVEYEFELIDYKQDVTENPFLESFAETKEFGYGESNVLQHEGMDLMISGTYQRDIITSNEFNEGILTLRLFDRNSNQNAQSVTYQLEISRDDKILLNNPYYSKGPFQVKIQPDSDCDQSEFWKCIMHISPPGVSSPPPGFNYTTTYEGTLTVKGPVFDKPGNYKINTRLDWAQFNDTIITDSLNFELYLEIREYLFSKSKYIPLSISSEQHVYGKNQTATILIKNEDDIYSSIFNLDIIDPRETSIKDQSCFVYEKPPNDILEPRSELEITWDIKNCNFELMPGVWEFSSNLTSGDKLTGLTKSLGIELVENLDLYYFPDPDNVKTKNQKNFMSNPTKGTYQIVTGKKTFDSPYEVISGNIDYLYITQGTLHFKTAESPGDVTLHVQRPSAITHTSKTCLTGQPSGTLNPLGGTVYNFTIQKPARELILLSNSSFQDFIVNLSSDPAEIWFQFSNPLVPSTVYPHCQKPLEWTKQDAGLWSKGKLSHLHFASMIQLLIEHYIIDGPRVAWEAPFPYDYKSAISEKITDFPSWLSATAGWWNEGKISDEEFLNSLEYLIKTKIIKFEN